MVLRRGAVAAVVLFCSAVLPTFDAQGTDSCQGGWKLFEGICYRLTASKLQHGELPGNCREQGASAVSIHSSAENDHVARVAGGNYVWLGMTMTGRNQYSWQDNTSSSYRKFLPAGNSMLKKSFVGAGIYQQSCKRWNYGRSSELRYGVCKKPAKPERRCPSGALERDGDCYIVAGKQAAWWEANNICYGADRLATDVTLRMEDWQLKHAITEHFGPETQLIVGAEAVGGSCAWSSLQYGQTTSHSCEFGCAKLLPVLCKRPKIPVGPEPAEPLKRMPPMYKGRMTAADETAASSVSECPASWSARGKRCVSQPTEPATRLWAEALCQDQNSSRLATVRTKQSQPILALQLQGVREAWVRDERPEVAPAIPARFSRLSYAAPRQPEYSVLTFNGEVLSRPEQQEVPAICEHCQLSCGPNAAAFAGHCYRLLEEAVSQEEASRACVDLGGSMVSIESGGENNFVSALAFPSSSSQCSQPDGAVWLGLIRSSTAFSWGWEDCSPFTAQFWASGAGHAGQCVTLSRDGSWTDSDRCRQIRLPAVCEWDPCEERSQYMGSCLQLPPGNVY